MINRLDLLGGDGDAWGDDPEPTEPYSSNPFGGGATDAGTENVAGGEDPFPGTGEEVIEVDNTYDDLATEEVENIRKGIASIEENVVEIEKLKQSAFEAVDNNTITAHLGKVDDLTQTSFKTAAAMREKIDELRRKNAEFKMTQEKNSSKVTWRQNQLRSLSKTLKQATAHITSAAEDFKKVVLKRQVRQACIITNVDDDEKEEIYKRAERDPYGMQQEIMQQIEKFGVSAATIDRIEELETQNQNMRSIEEGVKRIQEMFEQMAQLVEEQGEMLDEIEANVEVTRDHVAKAKQQITKAAEYKEKTRKRTFCIAICCIGLLVIVIVLIIIPNV